MQIEIKKSTIVNGKNAWAGDVVETDGQTALMLVAIGKAEIYGGASESPLVPANKMIKDTEIRTRSRKGR